MKKLGSPVAMVAHILLERLGLEIGCELDSDVQELDVTRVARLAQFVFAVFFSRLLRPRGCVDHVKCFLLDPVCPLDQYLVRIRVLLVKMEGAIGWHHAYLGGDRG